MIGHIARDTNPVLDTCDSICAEEKNKKTEQQSGGLYLNHYTLKSTASGDL